MPRSAPKNFIDGIKILFSRAVNVGLSIKIASGALADFTWRLPNANPVSQSSILIDTSGNWTYGSPGVSLTAPSVFAVSGSGTSSLSLTFATGQTANQVLASPDGTSGAVSLRALVANDIPNLATSKITGLSGFVTGFRLDQFAAPTAAVSFNGQRLTNVADATAGTDAPSWAQVQALFNGQDNKASVRVATTGSLTLTGATATTITNSGGLPSTIDGVALSANDRILVKNQAGAGATGAAANGIYIYASGNTWNRATDADISAEVTSGLNVFVSEGSTQAATLWFLSTADPITLGTTQLTFTQIGAGGTSYLAGNGLQLTGNTFSVLGTANRITVGGSGVDIASTYAGQTSIVTVGTIGTGTWQGTAVAVGFGGTGANSAAGARANLGAPGIYRLTFASTDLVGGVLTATHNLGNRFCTLQVFDDSGFLIEPDESRCVNTTQATIDMSAFVSGGATFTGFTLVAAG